MPEKPLPCEVCGNPAAWLHDMNCLAAFMREKRTLCQDCRRARREAAIAGFKAWDLAHPRRGEEGEK